QAISPASPVRASQSPTCGFGSPVSQTSSRNWSKSAASSGGMTTSRASRPTTSSAVQPVTRSHPASNDAIVPSRSRTHTIPTPVFASASRYAPRAPPPPRPPTVRDSPAATAEYGSCGRRRGAVERSANLGARGHLPGVDDLAAVAVQDHLVVHVHGAAGVIRHHRQQVTELRPRVAAADVHEPVLLVELVDHGVGRLDEQAETPPAL